MGSIQYYDFVCQRIVAAKRGIGCECLQKGSVKTTLSVRLFAIDPFFDRTVRQVGLPGWVPSPARRVVPKHRDNAVHVRWTLIRPTHLSSCPMRDRNTRIIKHAIPKDEHFELGVRCREKRSLSFSALTIATDHDQPLHMATINLN